MKSMNRSIDYSKNTFFSTTFKKTRFFALVCACVLISNTSLAISTEDVGGEQPSTMNPVGDKQFEYLLENRSDPFVPFITEKAATANVDMNEIIDNTNPLTGMQLFEPGQLTLVALLQNGSKDTAMVEDFTGKGYILTEGTKIGRRGVVKDIAPNTVIIEETAVTRAGKQIINEVVMILKKEGEE